MDEDVPAAVIRRDESKALERIEPFYFTRRRVASPKCSLVNGMVTEISAKKKPAGLGSDGLS